MIIFQTPNFKIDLSNRPLKFNETSEYYSEKVTKSFTFPFKIGLHEDIAVKLGLVNIPNIAKYEKKIYGYLILDNDFYDGYISINEVEGQEAELTLFYGKETLKVFDKKLSQLPFRSTTVTALLPTLPDLAQDYLEKTWPEVTHNFPKVYREDISDSKKYELFEGFINNYINDGGWHFPVNVNETIEGELQAANRYVMAPFTYVLEIFKVAFATERLEIAGDFVNDELVQKMLVVPTNFFEHFGVTQVENYNFSTPTSQETVGGLPYYVYTKTHTPTDEGTYNLRMKINMSNVMASYFSLTVKQGILTHFQAVSTGTSVLINQTLNINIDAAAVGVDVVVELKLRPQATSIAQYNSFTWEFEEGDLNVFPLTYNIADFMPDMTFRHFVNKMKSFLNLRFKYAENVVYINFLNDVLDNVVFKDMSHLQQVDPPIQLQLNNLFKLVYPNGKQVCVNKEGITYNENDYVESETQTLDVEVLPLENKVNKAVLTAEFPEDTADLMVCLYDGLVYNQPTTKERINGRGLSIEEVYDYYWDVWLKFRANAETYKESFYMHATETLDIFKGIFKYNKKHLIKTIRKTRVNKDYWKVDSESETL